VFVLATTEPHKVMPTIRSRTQHLEFRLIGGETLSSLLHDVKGAAGLAADDELIDARSASVVVPPGMHSVRLISSLRPAR